MPVPALTVLPTHAPFPPRRARLPVRRQQHFTSFFEKAVVENMTRSTEHCRALLSSMVQRLNADVKIKKVCARPVCAPLSCRWTPSTP